MAARSRTSKTNGIHGSVAITGGSLPTRPTPLWSATSFAYTVNGSSTIEFPSRSPASTISKGAVPNTDTVLEDSSATAIDVLANDTDIDGSSRSIAGKTNGSHGAVTIIGGDRPGLPRRCRDYSRPRDLRLHPERRLPDGGDSITVTCVGGPPPPPESGGSGTSTTTENIFPTPTASSTGYER